MRFFSRCVAAASGSVASGFTAAGPSGTSAAILSTDTFTEDTVKDVVALGFTRDQAIGELRQHNGNKTQAVAALFAKSLRF